MRANFRAAALAALLVLSFGGVGTAQKFPDRPVRIIVPNPAGGLADTVARILGRREFPLYERIRLQSA